MRFIIDIKIFLLLLLFFITKQLEFYLVIMISVIIHELGHLLTGIILGMEPEKFELHPVGVTISFKIDMGNLNKKIKKGNTLNIKKICVALAGPLTNVIIILIIHNLSLSITKEMIIIYANILIIIFNSLPIYPLDGGRIIKNVLHIFIGKRKSCVYISNISIIVTIVLTSLSSILVFYLHNIAIFFIISYLWVIVIKEYLRFRRLEQVYKILDNS